MVTYARWRAVSLALTFALSASMLALVPTPASATPAPAAAPETAAQAAAAAPVITAAKAPDPPSPPRRPDPPVDQSAKRAVAPFDPAKAKIVERTRKGDVYENPDGTRTLRAFSGPVNWQDSAGRWKPIDPTLVADGARGFKNRSGEVTFAFDKRADAAGLVRASTEDWSVAFGLEGARAGAAPVVDGQKIRYPDVGEGVHLEYAVGVDVLKEVVVLDRPLAPGASATFRFPLTLSGVTPRTEADGTIAFSDADGTKVAAIPPGSMHDASGDPAAGTEPASAPVATRLVRDKARWVVELAPERSWLDDPVRVYPLSVDPSFYAGWHTYGGDAFVGSGCGNCNYNGANQWDGNYVNKIGYSWYNDGWWEWRTYAYYDVGLANNQDILRADWYGHFYSASAANATFVMRPATTGWNEWGVNWANQPGGCCDQIFGAANSGYWTARDVRTWVYNWTHNLWANAGIEIDNWGQGQYLRMAAAESDGARSFIDITYNTLANTPSAPAPVSQWINSTTPTLCATYSDPNNDDGYLRFDIYNSAGAYVGNVVTGYVASGGRPCAAVPAGWVGEGNMWYNAFAFDGYNWSTGYASVWLGIDTTPPPGPTLSSSTHPSPSTWYPSGAFAASWPAVGDASGIAGYGVAVTTNGGAEAPSTVTQTAASYSTTVGDGTWYLNVRAKDVAGNWGANARFAFFVDATSPAAPSLGVTPAPLACGMASWSTANGPTFSFSTTDTSGVNGYSYVLDQASGTVPDTTSEGTATTKAYSGLDGLWYFHARARNGAGLWGPSAECAIRVDASAPANLAVSSSTHPNQASWYDNAAPALSWTASDTSGITGYSYLLDQATTTAPDTTSEGTATTKSYAGLADGVWYFHIAAQNGAASWGPPVHFAIRVDTSPSSVPVVSSPTHPDQNAWYPNNTPVLNWSAADATSGIAGYSHVIDQSATTTPDTTSEGTATTWTSPAKADGVWYFHVRAQNGAGTWSGPAHYTLRIDTGGPAAPVASSPTHPSTVWYPNANPSFTWTVPASVSPVTGYSWVLDQAAATDPDTTSDGTAPPASFTNVAPDGVWYFHVRARNAAGTWGPAGHRQVKIDITNPVAPALVVSLSHPAGVAVSNRSASVTWTPGSDATSGVAGYSWTFNQDQNTAADAVADGDALTLGATSASLPDGVSWFHVRTIDNAGNASTDTVYGPIMVDPNGPLGLSLTLPPLAKAASDELGLEQFAPYRRVDFGTATGYVHLRTGNVVVTQDEATIPRQGLNAVVRRVYNSTDLRDPDGMGPGWRLSVSDVTAGLEGVTGAVSDLDAGAGLVVANLVNSLGAITGQVVEFTDGDGTTHRFVRPGAPGTRWDSPPGVSLRLREIAGGYELVRPDGVVYRATNVVAVGLPQWRVTTVTDRHANRLTYDYAPVGPAGAMRLVAIRHNRDDAKILVRFDYANAKLVAVVSLPGLSGPDPAGGVVRSWERRSVLGYDTAGRLTSAVRNDQASAAGGRQSTGFSYTNAVLSAVTDGRGKTTTLAYEGAGTAARLKVVTDRRAKAWNFAYGAPDANGTQITTATDPGGAKVRYTISGRAPLADGRTAGGNIVAMADDGTDAGAVSSTYAWVANRLVSSTDGAGNVGATEYNDLGLATKLTRPAPNDPGRADIADPAYPKAPIATVIAYRYPAGFSYANCTEPASSGPLTTAGWCQMVADMERSAAADNVTAQRRVTDINPDPAGSVLSLVRRAAAGGVASADDRSDAFAYFTRGGLCSADGPRADVGDVTRFGDAANTAVACTAAPNAAYGGYDATGLPSRVLDALAKASDVAYTPYGKMAKSTDRDGRITTAHYDDRDNVVDMTDPAGSVTKMSYDANDNKVTETAPRGSATTTAGDFETRFGYDDNDWPTAVSWPGATEAAARAQVTTIYNDDATKATETNAVGGVTTFAYHPNRMVKQVAAPATTSGPKAVVDYRYDTAGRVVRTIGPAVDAAGASRPEEQLDYTPQGDVSVRRETSSTAGVWRTTRYAYNAHGEPAEVAGPRSIGAEQEATQVDYNAFGQPTISRRRLVGRWLSTPTSYDAAGNATATSTLTGANQLLTSTYRYDALGRVAAQTTDPTNAGHKVAFTYEGEGAQLTRVDLRQTAGPSSAACGDAGVSCVAVRTTTNAYNGDATPSSSVATDDTGKALTTCHYPAGQAPSAGYDADKHPLAVRTLTATTSCNSGGSLQRQVTMGYDSRGLLATMAQSVRSPDTGTMVTRAQSFTHRADTTVATATHDGRTTTYGRSPAGWTELLTDWRAKVSTTSYSPAGAPTATAVGSGTASSTRTYTADGMPASLVWSAGAATVRSHTAIGYDVGGLRTAESVAVVHPSGTTADTGGQATYGYDLARRLVSYTSPYKAAAADPAKPTTSYTLDDGANITAAATAVAGQTRRAESSTYPGGLLATRNATTTPPSGPSISAGTTFGYSSLGEERTRTTTTAGGSPPPATTTTGYDAAGHVGSAGAVTYVYDGTDHLVSRKEGLAISLYFYWGGGATLAEETDGVGTALTRYVVDGGDIVAQHTFRRLGAIKDPTDVNGTWAWLLDDPAGNVATQVDDNGAVTGQAAFDPYGVPEKGGKSQAPGTTGTSLGFQAALTDGSTKKVMLGPRQYDPETARFTNPDVYVGGAADVQLGADALTGNRFLFAGANPVAYYDDGHCSVGKEVTSRKKVGSRLGRVRQEWVVDPTHYGGGYNKSVYDKVSVYDYETKCVHSLDALVQNVRSARQAISAVGTVASFVAAGSTGIAAACAASLIGIACSVPALGIAGFASGVSAISTGLTSATCSGRGCQQSVAQVTLAFAVFRVAKLAGPGVRAFGVNAAEAIANAVGYCASPGSRCRL